MSSFRSVTVKTGRFEMDCAVFGKGQRPFVILPGISAEPVVPSAGSVALAYGSFAERCRVFLFDRVRELPEDYTVEQMAEDTAEAMKELGIENAFVFGASQGGMIAMCLAADHPELVAKAVFGSSSLRLDGNERLLMERWIRLAEEEKAEELYDDMYRHIYSQEYYDRYAAAFALLAANGTKEGCRRVKILAKACLAFDFTKHKGLIRCPALSVGARQDRVLGSEASKRIAAFTGGELFMYEKGSHAVYDEAPDYKEKLLAFYEGMKNGMKLKITTFNIQHCENFRTEEIDFDAYAKAIASFGADVTGLNEVRSGGERSEYGFQTEILSEKTGMNGYFAKATEIGKGNPYGNAVLTKLKIKNCRTVPIPDPEKPAYDGYYETRCVLVLETEEPEMTFLITHFGLNPDEHENAVKTVLSLIKDERCVLMGDMNVTPDDPLLTPIRERMNDSAAASDKSLYSFPSDNPDRKIDYIFTSKDIRVLSAEVPELVLSDHRPLCVTAEL